MGPGGRRSFLYVAQHTLIILVQNVPLDATLAGSPPRSKVSRFRSSLYGSRAAGASASTSLSDKAIVVDSNALRGAVRLGKLDDDELVGGEEGESGSEDDQITKAKEAILMGNSETIKNSTLPREQPAAGMNVASGSVVERRKPHTPDLTSKPSATSPSTPIATPSRFRALHQQLPKSDAFARSASSTPIDAVARSSPKTDAGDDQSDYLSSRRSGVVDSRYGASASLTSFPTVLENPAMREEVRESADPTTHHTQTFTEPTPAPQSSAPRKISRFKAARTG